MSNLVRCKQFKEAVNLDKISYIHFSDKGSKIYFVFDSMNNDEINEVEWSFKCSDSYKKVKSFFDGISEVLD